MPTRRTVTATVVADVSELRNADCAGRAALALDSRPFAAEPCGSRRVWYLPRGYATRSCSAAGHCRWCFGDGGDGSHWATYRHFRRLKRQNEANANLGYAHTRLLTLSRRDRLAGHLANNIVPLAQDDDLVVLGPELRQYSVVTEIPNTSWKLALSRAMIKA